MGVTILHYNAVPGWRGGEQQGLYLIKGLTEYPVTQYCMGQPGSVFLERTAPYVTKTFPVRSRGELNPGAVHALIQIIREYKIDIVHTHTTHAHSLALQAKHLYNNFHLIAHRRVDFAVKNNPLSLYKYKSAKLDKIIAISQFIKELLIGQDVPESKIEVIYSGVDPQRLQCGSSDTRARLLAEYKIDGKQFILGNIAALTGHKDHITLINALSICLKKEYNCTLFILGDGNEKKNILGEIKALGVENNVIMPGFRTDLQNFIGGFDLYVHSSMDEGLGTSIIDALANRIPVVSTDAGGIPELLGNNEFGLLVPKQNPQALAEGIIRMLDNRALRKNYEKKASERARQFTVEAMVEKTFQLYRKIHATAL
ncbi:MAG: glycosyltransferase family 4 protein [Chlorobi bacterium]|nr:glycosyltransferase family 4 protein [Chlorobiota bacterium]